MDAGESENMANCRAANCRTASNKANDRFRPKAVIRAVITFSLSSRFEGAVNGTE